MTLPMLDSRMLPRLYDRRSLVRAALTTIGKVPAAKMTVAMTPASSGICKSMAARVTGRGRSARRGNCADRVPTGWPVLCMRLHHIVLIGVRGGRRPSGDAQLAED